MITKPDTVSSVRAGDSSDWRNAVRLFLSELDAMDSSRRLYGRTLGIFFKWVGDTGRRLDGLSRGDIIIYKEWLLNGGLSSLTVSSYLTSLRKFYQWAESERLYPNIVRDIKTPRRVQTFRKSHLDEGQSTDLLHHFARLSVRDFAIVNLMLRTGLRTIEVIRLNVEDITRKGDRRILRIWGKGRAEKDSYVVLSDKAYQPISLYLSMRHDLHSGDPLFASRSNRNRGGRLTTRTISGICKKGLRSVGLEGHEYSAHSLRHTTAVTLLKSGAGLLDAQTVLRHNSPATTQIYVESAREEIRLRNAPELLIDDKF